MATCFFVMAVNRQPVGAISVKKYVQGISLFIMLNHQEIVSSQAVSFRVKCRDYLRISYALTHKCALP